jgi:hypothetical protein
MVHFAVVISAALLCSASALELSNQFASSMVLQREPLSACLHGAAAAGERVTLTLFGVPSAWQSMTDATGHWRVCMDPQPAGGPHVLNIVAGEDGSTRARSDLAFCDPDGHVAGREAAKTRRTASQCCSALLSPNGVLPAHVRCTHVTADSPARPIDRPDWHERLHPLSRHFRTASWNHVCCTVLLFGMSCSAKYGIALVNLMSAVSSARPPQTCSHAHTYRPTPADAHARIMHAQMNARIQPHCTHSHARARTHTLTRLVGWRMW